MARKVPETPQLRRRASRLAAKKRVIVVCEGEITEPQYLRDFARLVRNPLVQLEIIEKGGGVRELVQKVLNKNKELALAAKKSGNSFDKLFTVWGMPDVDEHQKLKEAINLADEHDLNIALSNPCFEIWAILHFDRYDAHIHRHAAQKYLKTKMPKYCHEKSPVFDIDLLKGKYLKAKSNAEWINQRRIEEGIRKGNPSTNVFELLDDIIEGSPVPIEEI